jgi:hypothetical protein
MTMIDSLYQYIWHCLLREVYRVIRKSVKHLTNSPQINYATGHDYSYANRERESLEVFFRESPRAELPWFAAMKQPYHRRCGSGRPR